MQDVVIFNGQLNTTQHNKELSGISNTLCYPTVPLLCQEAPAERMIEIRRCWLEVLRQVTLTSGSRTIYQSWDVPQPNCSVLCIKPCGSTATFISSGVSNSLGGSGSCCLFVWLFTSVRRTARTTTIKVRRACKTELRTQWSGAHGPMSFISMIWLLKSHV